MNNTLRAFIAGAFTTLCLIVILPCVCAKERLFAGKVIDAETKAPIEGMVVLAYWHNPKGKPIVKEIKETLTDEKGEWTIVGEEIERNNLHPYLSIIQPDHYRLKQQPGFIIFKPGYESYSSRPEYPYYNYTSVVYPYLDRNVGLEGIILWIDQKESDYLRKFISKDPIGVKFGLPFISVKDAENKLKRLDIPFDYNPFNAKRLYDLEDLYKNKRGLFYTYTLFGFKRLIGKQDRAHALITPIFEYFDDEPAKERELLKKQRNFLRLFEEECKYLGINWHESYKKKLEGN